MTKYLIRRLFLMVPSFLGITLFSFLFINMAPGGPIEQKLQAIRMGSAGEGGGTSRGSAIVSDEIINELKHQYGFDKPIYIRYFLWLKNLLSLNLGNSFVYEEPVFDVIVRRFPISFQFGLAAFFFIHALSIPIGIFLAVHAHSFLDRFTQGTLFILYGIPPLIMGISLIVLFSGASHFSWFPTGGFVSDNYQELNIWQKIQDRIWHFILPFSVYVIGGLTTHIMLMRNSMLEVIGQDYIRTARAKGLSERLIHYKHALRNALIPMLTGVGSYLSVFLSGSLIVETVFRIDGIGHLGYKALMDRDYNLIMGLIFLSSVTLMLGRLLSDCLYVIFDPRIELRC